MPISTFAPLREISAGIFDFCIKKGGIREGRRQSGGTEVAGKNPRSQNASVIIGALAMLGDIEAFALAIDRDTQTDKGIDDLVDDERADA